MPQRELLTFSGSQGELEGLLSFPDASPHHAIQDVVLILHPHPLYGGNMNNKVVTTLSKACNELDATTMIFNFPGVGKSAGIYQHGKGEIDDGLHAIQFLKNRFPHATFHLAGFSFGAYIAYSLSFLMACKHLMLIAPPVTHFDMKRPISSSTPCLVVQGEKDEVIDAQAVFDWVNEYGHSAQLVRMSETTHFFHGKLSMLNDAVKAFWNHAR